MTTIAWDGITLVADRQTTKGSTRGSMKKIYQLNNNKFLAGAGDTVEINMVYQWLKAGGKKKSKPDIEESEFLLLDKRARLCYSMDHRLVPMLCEGYAAIGSGSDFALGAMHAGATAERAVIIASKLDVYTGEGVDKIETTTTTRKQ